MRIIVEGQRELTAGGIPKKQYIGTSSLHGLINPVKGGGLKIRIGTELLFPEFILEFDRSKQRLENVAACFSPFVFVHRQIGHPQPKDDEVPSG